MTAASDDPQTVAAAEDAARSMRERDLNDLRVVLDLAAGRRLLWRLLGMAGIYEGTVRGDGVELAALRDGRRQLGIELLQEIHAANDEAYVRMQVQHLEDERDRARIVAEAQRAAQEMRDSDGLA